MVIKKISKTSFIIILLHILEPILFSADENPTVSFNNKDGSSRKITHDKSGKKIFIFYNKEGEITSGIMTQKDGLKRLVTTDPTLPGKEVRHIYSPDGFKQSHHIKDGSSRKIIHDKSGKKKFIFYNKEGEVTSIIATQKDGLKRLVTTDPTLPGKEVKHTYLPDGFKQSHHLPDDLITEKAPDEDSVHADRTTFHIAYHEAAHTLANALKYNLVRPLKVVITPKGSQQFQDTNIKVGGYLQSEQTYLEQLTKQQLTNALIACLSGAIGEQIFYNTKMLQDEQEIQLLYRQPSMRSDMSDAEQIGLLLLQSNYNEQFHTLLAETYKETYLFQSKYKKYLRKLAHALVKKESLTQDEIYNIVDIAAKPLKFGEIGPLEKQFEDDYPHREIVMNKIKKQKEKIPQTSVVHDGQVKKSPFAQDNSLPNPAFKPNFRYRY